jgi:hypothetical protein
MKDVVIDRLQKLSECMTSGCNKCSEINKNDKNSSKERCCDSTFCAITNIHLLELGQSYEEVPLEDRVTPSVVYLKKGTGCVIPPEHRPFCTMYACPGVLHHDRKLRREYNRLHDKLKDDPEILKLGELHQEAIRLVLKKQRLFT